MVSIVSRMCKVKVMLDEFISENSVQNFDKNDLFTYPSAPSRAPENVHVKLLDHNGVEVTWDPLEAKYANGKLLGYKVHIREWKNHYEWGYDDGDMGDVIRVNSTDTHLALEGLDGGRKYQIAVAAFTVDDGPISDWETVLIGKQEINSSLHCISEQESIYIFMHINCLRILI